MLGCGGGGASSSGTPQAPAPAVVSAGVYSASVSQRTFVGALTSDNYFYGVHFNALANAPDDIYSGRISGLGTSSVFSPTPLSLYQNTTARSFAVNASMAPGSGNLLNILLSQPSGTALNFGATPASLLPAVLSNVASTWSGKFSYGLGAPTNFSITIDGSGVITSASAFGQNSQCRITSGSQLSAANTSLGLFNLNLVIDKTNCPQFTDQTLSGVAFVLLNPESGITQRLIWIASSSSGTGIAFKADR